MQGERTLSQTVRDCSSLRCAIEPFQVIISEQSFQTVCQGRHQEGAIEERDDRRDEEYRGEEEEEEEEENIGLGR